MIKTTNKQTFNIQHFQQLSTFDNFQDLTLKIRQLSTFNIQQLSTFDNFQDSTFKIQQLSTFNFDNLVSNMQF